MAVANLFDMNDKKNGDKQKARLLADAGIVRNRLKIDAAIGNAQAWLRLREEEGGAVDWLWSFVGGKPIVSQVEDDKGQPGEATNVSEKLAADAAVLAVIGHFNFPVQHPSFIEWLHGDVQMFPTQYRVATKNRIAMVPTGKNCIALISTIGPDLIGEVFKLKSGDRF